MPAIAAWLDRLAGATGIAEKRFARAQLERALTLADPEALSDVEAERALDLGVSREAVAVARRPRPPHAVRVPLVAEDASVEVRAFVVAFEPVEGRGALGEEADAACRSAIAAAAGRLAARPDAARYRFVPCSPASLDGVRIDGPSLGAACFVSAASLFSDRPVRAGLVVTGAIDGARVVGVGSVRRKIDAARALGASIVVPFAGETEGATAVETLDALERTCLEARAETDPDALVARAATAARDGWSGYRWRSVREATTRALAIVPDGRPELRVDALAQLAAASRHLGDLAGSGEAITLALAVCASDVGKAGVPDVTLCRLERQRAMHEKSSGRLREAAASARRAVALATKARLRGELLKSLGTQGLVCMARGDAEAALAPLTEALALTVERTPRDAARSRAYLVEALGELGRLDEARALASEALAECANDGARGRAKEAWVRTSLGAAFVLAAAFDDAARALDHETVHEAIARDPLPGLLSRRWLGVALWRRGDGVRGSALLTAGSYAYGDVLEPSLRFAADVNLLHDAAERARGGEAPPDRVPEIVARIASFEATGALLARPIAAALRPGRRARRAEALHRLALEAGRLSR